ncbi:helicase RepA family protein [Rhizobium pusense]|uniref:AAA family ATPase n=1 Tax=Agrobacterium pusense TaxID=648995 RepID=UPI00244A67AB|nr:AAA family ATPase [Agrobacterium pusense]MDH2091112.1 helicase RepA family protein [Agrobacterium pusense]
MKDIDWHSSSKPSFTHNEEARFRFHRTFGAIPPKHYVVDGFLAKGEVSCFFGEPGATKSTIALDIACHVASGLPWMGRGTGFYAEANSTEPAEWLKADVLYVALERADQVQRRVEAFTDEYGLNEPMRLAIYDGDLDFVGDASDRLTQIVLDAEQQSWDIEQKTGSDGFNVDLIVIDTLARTFGSGSDSGGEETAKVARHLQRTLKWTGAHILLVHHTPIGDDSRLRGHGNLLAAFDQTVRVQKLKGGSLATVQKDNDIAEDQKPKFAYGIKSRVVQVDERSGREITASVVVPLELDQVKQKQPKMAKAPKGPSPSKGEQPVLDALASSEGPVTEDVWRAAYDAAKDEGTTLANHRTRFSRGKTSLEAKGLIKQDDAGLWTVTVSELQLENCNS